MTKPFLYYCIAHQNVMKTNNVKPMSICMHLSIRMHVDSCLPQEHDHVYLEFADLLVLNVLK